MKAIIMAGGLGTRLKPLTHIIPKPLLPVGEQSVLEISIQKLKACGFNELIIATNYKSQLFESYFGDGSQFGVKIKYSKEKERLGTAGPLKLIEEELKEPFLVINGDILTNMDFKKLVEFHIKNNADITLVTKEIVLPLNYGVVKSKDSFIEEIEEKPEIKSEVNAGIYILSPGVLKHIPNGFYNMTELIQKLLKEKHRLLRYPLEGYWLDVGQIKDYKKAQKDAENGNLNL